MQIQRQMIVTIFTLFYGVLKWVYRKRGKELAAVSHYLVPRFPV